MINTDKKEKDRKFQTAPLPFKVVYISSSFFLLAIGSPDLSQTVKEVIVFQGDHTKKTLQLFSLKMTTFDHFV